MNGHHAEDVRGQCRLSALVYLKFSEQMNVISIPTTEIRERMHD